MSLKSSDSSTLIVAKNENTKLQRHNNVFISDIMRVRYCKRGHCIYCSVLYFLVLYYSVCSHTSQCNWIMYFLLETQIQQNNWCAVCNIHTQWRHATAHFNSIELNSIWCNTVHFCTIISPLHFCDITYRKSPSNVCHILHTWITWPKIHLELTNKYLIVTIRCWFNIIGGETNILINLLIQQDVMY